jgi:hypothetical protein
MSGIPLGERRSAASATIVRLSQPEPAFDRYAFRIDSIMAVRGSLSRQRALLTRAARDLEQATAAPPRSGAAAGVYYTRGIELEDQLAHLNAAAWQLGRVVFDAVVDDDKVVSGQLLHWTLSTWNASDEPRVADMRAAECVPLGECRGPEPDSQPRSVPPGQVGTITTEYQVLEQPPSTPYFLTLPRAGDLYRWPEPSSDRSASRGGLPAGEPFEPPTFLGSVEVNAGERDSLGASRTAEAVYRYNDQARGEVRRPVTVVPRVDVKLDPETEVWPITSTAPHRFQVTLTHGARDTTSGTVRLQLPRGWPITPPQRFRFTEQDERATFTFAVRPPARLVPDSLEFRAIAEDSAGTSYDVGVFTVDYPHIRPRSYTRRAAATVRTAALSLPHLARVGYVRGAADRVPEALQGVGIPVVLLGPATLENGNLDRYDVIVVGPRAYETDPALLENNRRLLAYARRGGLVLVQYQQHQYFNGGFAPFPMTVGGQPLRLEESTNRGGTVATRATPPVSHDRVTDENAPVRLVTPEHPVFRTPNRITDGDWRGWVQERGLYFARSWNRRYQPVLETHDPGEPPLRGGLLIAPVGKGTYVYTGLSFFRQLPAGVPGAFRLFANLLALRRR